MMVQDLNNLVSVIMPSYNSEAYIKATIDSVIKQTYENWELIVIDDCSSDSTLEIVKEYARIDSRIRFIELTENKGAPAAPRNIGIEKANGRWVALLDADDIWHPKKLTLQISAMLDSKSDFSCTQMKDFYDEKTITYAEPGKIDLEKISFKKLRIKGRIPTSSVIATRELLLKYPFNESIEYKAVEDYHCWLRIHQNTGNSIKLSYPLLNYRKVATQISASKSYMLKKIYMVHKEYPGSNFLKTVVFSLTHALGAIYFRFIKKSL